MLLDDNAEQRPKPVDFSGFQGPGYYRLQGGVTQRRFRFRLCRDGEQFAQIVILSQFPGQQIPGPTC